METIDEMIDDDIDDSVLRGVAAAPSQPPSIPTLTGQMVGRYRVLGLLGKGGMGWVYEAVDTELGRRVAMKLARGDSLNCGIAHTRFRRERAITAELEHPNIMPVYDVGFAPSGEPYYVMRMARGEPLDRKIAEAKTIETRLALLPSLIAVSDAIAFAHNRGIIHRDIKPHNVLVGAFGETLVADWGLAKHLGQPADDTTNESHTAVVSHTRVGDVVGTPGYMAPEQARGCEVDERTDVFALGAMLFHLVVQEPPSLARDATDSALAAVGAPTELIAIVNKALQVDPAARYQQSKEFADDLRRFVAGHIVSAYTYSRTELVRRWARRHRPELSIGAVLGALLVILAIGSVLRIVRERDQAEAERATAETSRAEAARERARAERRFNDVRQLATSFLFEFHDAILPLAGATKARELVVRRAQDYLEGLAQEAGPGDASLQRDLASAYLTLARIQDGGGEPGLHDQEAARASLVKAVALREGLAAADPDDPAAAQELAKALGALSLAELGPEGIIHATRALHIRQTLAARAPGDRFAAHALAASELNLGIAQSGRREYQAAAEHDRNAVTILERLSAEGPADPTIQRELALGYKYLAGQLQRQGNLAAAGELVTNAVELDEARMVADPNNPLVKLDLSYSYGSLAFNQRKLGDLIGALATYRKALALREQVAAADPADAGARSAVAKAEGSIGYVLRQAGRLAEALEWSTKTAIHYEALWHDKPHDAVRRSALIDAYTSVGQVEAALATSVATPRAARRGHSRAVCEWWRKTNPLIHALRDDGQPAPDADVVAWVEGQTAACGGDVVIDTHR